MSRRRYLSPAEWRRIDEEADRILDRGEVFEGDGWCVLVEYPRGAAAPLLAESVIPGRLLGTESIPEEADPEDEKIRGEIRRHVREELGGELRTVYAPRLRGWWGVLPNGEHAYGIDPGRVAEIIAEAREAGREAHHEETVG